MTVSPPQFSTTTWPAAAPSGVPAAYGRPLQVAYGPPLSQAWRATPGASPVPGPSTLPPGVGSSPTIVSPSPPPSPQGMAFTIPSPAANHPSPAKPLAENDPPTRRYATFAQKHPKLNRVLIVGSGVGLLVGIPSLFKSLGRNILKEGLHWLAKHVKSFAPIEKTIVSAWETITPKNWWQASLALGAGSVWLLLLGRIMQTAFGRREPQRRERIALPLDPAPTHAADANAFSVTRTTPPLPSPPYGLPSAAPPSSASPLPVAPLAAPLMAPRSAPPASLPMPLLPQAPILYPSG